MCEYREIRAELAELRSLHQRLLHETGDENLLNIYTQKIHVAEKTLRDIESSLDTLGPTERRLMRLRYIEGLSWQAVSRRIHYSWQQTHRIHKNALVKLRAVMPSEERR